MNPGQRIDRFQIERLLGRGGMAEVYLARDTQLARWVALKRLRGGRGDATSTVRFLREARFASSFHHPCAVVVYDIFEHEDQPYIAMEFVEGRTLRSLVGDASVPAGRRLRWIVDAARALGAAHRAGLVHRDVKPHNIMVTDDGRVKVLDFGIARIDRALGAPHPIDVEDDSLPGITQTGAIVGTPLYSSPEQLSGQPVDSRSDQFSWALTAYELLCGYLPWRRRDAMTVLAQLVADDVPSMGERIAEIVAEARDPANRVSDPTMRASDPGQSGPPPPPDPVLFEGVPLGVEPVIACALARDPERRFPTIDDAADALEEYAEDPRSTALQGRGGRAALVSIPPPPGTPGSSSTPKKSSDRIGRAPHHRKGARDGQEGSASDAARSGPASRRVPLGASAADAGPVSVRSPTLRNGVSAIVAPTPPHPTPPSAATPVAISSVAPPSSPISDPSEKTAGGPPEVAPFDPRSSSPTLRASGTPPAAPRTPWWRKPAAIAAFVAIGGTALMAGLVRVIEASQPGPAAPSVGSSAAPAPVEVARVSCVAAEVRGSIAAPDAARILGSAACVRLAVELGLDWSTRPSDAARSRPPLGDAVPTPRSPSNAEDPALSVIIDATSAPVRATLSIGGVESNGLGSKPLDAIRSAVGPLASGLRAAGWGAAGRAGAAEGRSSDAGRAAWGAASQESAARALREVRRAGLFLSADPRADLSRWAEEEPRSPWPWLLFASAGNSGDPSAALGRSRALPVPEGLPSERADLVQGLLSARAPSAPGESAEGLRKLRRAFVLAPEDAEIEAALAIALFRAGRTDEAMPVARRLAARGSRASMAALVVSADVDTDPQWATERGKLLDAIEAWLPESRMWPSRVRYELSAGRVDEASGCIEEGALLGLPVTARTGDLGRATIALSRLDARRARELVRPLVMSPDPFISSESARLLAQSFLLEGKVSDAETEIARDIERQVALGNESLQAARYAWLLSIRRRLGQPAPAFIDPAKLRVLAEGLLTHEDPNALALLAELSAAQIESGAERPAAGEQLLARAESFATRATQGDGAAHDAILLSTAPIAGLVHNARRALEWHRSLARAPHAARLPHMLALGRLCEQGGDAACAEASFREVARSPWIVDGLDYVVARLRLADLIEKRDPTEAASLRDPISKLLVGADADVVRLLSRRSR